MKNGTLMGLNKIRLFIELVKFEHTIFALPFAYLGALLAFRGIFPLSYWLWITLAMVGARTAGMALNRLIDCKIDAKNLRTANRALPQGLIPLWQVWLLVFGGFFLLFFSAYHLNFLALVLSPLAIVLLVSYSYFKRFTWATHFGIGVILACAPMGGWIAIRGDITFLPVILSLGVLCWAAGFDIIYAMQDLKFDQEENLYSIPRSFGLKKALTISKTLHLLTITCLFNLGILAHLTIYYWVGLVMATILLVYEHRLISPFDLSKVNQAFFAANGLFSLTVFIFTTLSLAK